MSKNKIIGVILIVVGGLILLFMLSQAYSHWPSQDSDDYISSTHRGTLRQKETTLQVYFFVYVAPPGLLGGILCLAGLGFWKTKEKKPYEPGDPWKW